MHTKTTILTLALPLALALGVPAHAQPAGSGAVGAINSVPPAGTVLPSNGVPPGSTGRPGGTAPSASTTPPAGTAPPTGAIGALAAFGLKLKTSPPNGCAKQWVIDGKKGLSILDERALARRQQLLALASALPPLPKDKRLSREEYDSASATAVRLKTIELEMQCDATNRYAFVKEGLGWDKSTETAASHAKNQAVANEILMDVEKIRRKIASTLQQIKAANATATGEVARNP